MYFAFFLDIRLRLDYVLVKSRRQKETRSFNPRPPQTKVNKRFVNFQNKIASQNQYTAGMNIATIETLIETVKCYPCLYDKEQASRANIDQKNQVWIEIANKIDQPVEKCKSKWRNLRDSYLKAIKYKHELGLIGKLSLYRGYKHEDSLSFLETSSLKKRRSSSDGRSRFVWIGLVQLVF